VAGAHPNLQNVDNHYLEQKFECFSPRNIAGSGDMRAALSSAAEYNTTRQHGLYGWWSLFLCDLAKICLTGTPVIHRSRQSVPEFMPWGRAGDTHGWTSRCRRNANATLKSAATHIQQATFSPQKPHGNLPSPIYIARYKQMRCQEAICLVEKLKSRVLTCCLAN